MSTLLLNSGILLGLYILLIFISVVYSNKYSKYRKEAFSTMRKTKLIIYSAPLIFSILCLIFFYQTLEEHIGLFCIWIILIGATIGAILFDVFESKRIKESKT